MNPQASRGVNFLKSFDNRILNRRKNIGIITHLAKIEERNVKCFSNIVLHFLQVSAIITLIQSWDNIHSLNGQWKVGISKTQ